jgi:hypothetical protein
MSFVSADLLLALQPKYSNFLGYLPVFAASDVVFSVSEVQMGENFVSGHEGLISLHIFLFIVQMVDFAPFLALLANAVLIWNFKSATETSAVFFLVNCLVKMLFVLHSACLL